MVDVSHVTGSYRVLPSFFSGRELRGSLDSNAATATRKSSGYRVITEFFWCFGLRGDGVRSQPGCFDWSVTANQNNRIRRQRLPLPPFSDIGWSEKANEIVRGTKKNSRFFSLRPCNISFSWNKNWDRLTHFDRLSLNECLSNGIKVVLFIT